MQKRRNTSSVDFAFSSQSANDLWHLRSVSTYPLLPGPAWEPERCTFYAKKNKFISCDACSWKYLLSTLVLLSSTSWQYNISKSLFRGRSICFFSFWTFSVIFISIFVMRMCSFIHGLVLFLRMETFPGRSRLPILMANPSADERKTILWYILLYFSLTFRFYKKTTMFLKGKQYLDVSR